MIDKSQRIKALQEHIEYCKYKLKNTLLAEVKYYFKNQIIISNHKIIQLQNDCISD